MELPGYLVQTLCHECTALEDLSIVMDDENAVDFLEISSLKELRVLKMQFDENFTLHDAFDYITKLTLLKIQKVELDMFSCDQEVQKRVFANIGMNWGKIEDLDVTNCFVPLNVLMECITTLKILFYKDQWMFESHHFRGKVYPLMEKLSLQGAWNVFEHNDSNGTSYGNNYGSITSTPNLLSNAFPNLKYLEFWVCNYYGGSLFQSLLAMRVLEEVDLYFSVNSRNSLPTSEDADAMRKMCQKIEKCIIQFSCSHISEFVNRLVKFLGEKYCRPFGCTSTHQNIAIMARI